MSPFLRRLLATTLVAASSAFAAFGQPPDRLLEEAKKQREIATQRAEADLRATLQKAAKAPAAESVKVLKEALDRILINDEISTSRKDAMVRMLKDRIRITEQVARTSPAKPATNDSEKVARTNERLAALEKQKVERDKIRNEISQIVQLQGKGNHTEAERRAKDLASKYPDNSAAQAMGRSGFLNARIREARAMIAEQDRRMTLASRDIDKSSLPPTGDIEFDKKRWAEITKLRKQDELTAKEKAILKALNEPVKAQWRNSALRDVIEYLATVSGQTLYIDKRALDDETLTDESPVSFFAPREVTMRTALRAVLKNLGLTYVVKDEIIYITSERRARDMMVTKTYYVGDLTTGLGPLGNPLQFGPLIAAQQEMENAKMIAEMIKEQVDPSSWQGSGGSGTITYSPINKAFIIRQSAEIHSLLKGGLLR